MYKKSVVLLSGYLCYALLVWILKENVKEMLLISMPLREMYSPSIASILLFYIVPLVIGYLAGRSLKKKNSSPPLLASLFLPLFLSLLFILPMLIVFTDEIKTDPYLFITLGYSFLLIPIVFVTGSLVNFLGSGWHVIKEEPKHDVQSSIRRYLPVICVALLVALLNTIPVLLCDYPVGNDVWSHAAISDSMTQDESYFQNPFFYERVHYYTPLVHFIINKISQITQVSVIDLWRIYQIPLSAIFILLLFSLSTKLTKSHSSAFLATLFIIPWFSLLWMDPSPRLFALCLLLVMLYSNLKGLKGNKKFFILSGISFVGILLSHTEIAAHAIIISIVMIILAKYYGKVTGTIIFLFKKARLIRPEEASGTFQKIDLHSVERKFCIMLLMYVAVVLYFVALGTIYHTNTLFIFSEIGLSFLMPMGSISFIVFLFGLPALLTALKHRTPENILLLSVGFLYTSVFFCFTHLWQFYHRYFAEVAYIALSIMAAMVILKIISNNKRVAITIITSVVLLLFASVLPRADNMLDYAPDTQYKVDSRINILDDIKTLERDSVILSNPDDIINRYIPAIAGKYIFCGGTQPSREQQWVVINDLGILASEKNDSQKRFDLGEAFFQDPSILDEIRKDYRVTHILVTEKEYSKLNLESDDRLDMISKNNGYVLLAIHDKLSPN